MATLTTMKSRLALDLKRNDLTARIAYAITDAIGEYQGSRFAFNQLRTTFATVANQEFYTTSTIPTDIAAVDDLTITSAGSRTKLRERSYSWMEQISTTTTSTGEPTNWAWYANQIRLYPIPNAVYTLTLSYHQRLAEPAADGDSNAWTTEAEVLIRACARKIIYRDVLLNPALASASEQAEMIALRRLKREANQLEAGILAGSGI